LLATHELVADIPIVLEVRNLVRAPGSAVFKQKYPGISDNGNMTARLIVERCRLAWVRGHCVQRGREDSGQSDRGCKTLHVTSPIMNVKSWVANNNWIGDELDLFSALTGNTWT
jgi:hypothetical protein